MSVALYRRYRPDTFNELIGQEHVTEPLTAALRQGRANHAYLFSGPRGCGKTSSARIFARCLNCSEGPTDTPCGVCDSCVELATGGPGSLDVVEIDAASHNGVDDARELRERAIFAPARDRFKIFILDEAHMVTPQGFNALLKLVEEPPEHVKFVFATTEPEKVIGTIRSRTHHYPFRLVPPATLTKYLQQICDDESIAPGPGVLPLVVRAGAGSVRDTLSVLDQLIAGTEGGQLSYEKTAALLGYTAANLLDDAVDALAGRDGAALFGVVEHVVGSGHDPRRFVEDLLQRLRDLVIVAMAGVSGESALGALPHDQLDRMRAQAQHLGAAGASRAADLVNAALFEMTGATSPRLQLELLCARLLLPASDPGGALAARVETLERLSGELARAPRLSAIEPGAARVAGQMPEVESAPRAARVTGQMPEVESAPRAARVTGQVPEAESSPSPDQAEAGVTPAVQAFTPPVVEREDVMEDVPQTAHSFDEAGEVEEAPGHGPEGTSEEARPGAGSGSETTLVRRRWGEVLENLGRIRRASWALVSQSAVVGEIRGGVMYLIFETEGLAQAFSRGHDEMVALALRETLGLKVQVKGVFGDDGNEQPDSGPWTGGSPAAAAPPAPPPNPARPREANAEPCPEANSGTEPELAKPGRMPVTESELSGEPDNEPDPTPSSQPNPEPNSASYSAPEADLLIDDEEASLDDPDAEDSGRVGISALVRILGATVEEVKE